MIWLEKAAYYIGWSLERVVLDDGLQFVVKLLSFHGLKTYFTPNMEISYRGDYLEVDIVGRKVEVRCIDKDAQRYRKPKIMYMPAERNFLHYLDASVASKLLPPPLVALLGEYRKARAEVVHPYVIPINGYRLVYDEQTDEYLIENEHADGESSRTPVPESSSGLQSLIPLLLVSNYLSAHIGEGGGNTPDLSSLSWGGNPFLTVSGPDNRLGYLGSSNVVNGLRFMKRSVEPPCRFINIVEEPEQNLFPPTQRRVLRQLLSVNNAHKGNYLIVSTHSPYVVSDLVAATKAHALYTLCGDSAGRATSVRPLIEKCYPQQYSVSDDDVALYETNYDGTICRLEKSNGLIADSNFLNRHLQLGNMLLDELCHLEDMLKNPSLAQLECNA